jgi:tetratricopeptide (TPR) repeat protein
MDGLQGKQIALTDRKPLAELNASNGRDGVRRLYTLSELIELLQISRRRIRTWLKAGLICPAETEHGIPYFDFSQVACAKTLFEMTKAGVSMSAIRRNLEQLKEWYSEAHQPLNQLNLLEKNGQLLLRIEEGLVEPSGQMYFDFGEECAVVSMQPTSAESWFHLGIDNEVEGLLNEAADAYRQALALGGPDCDVAFNLANVLYSLGKKEEASERYRQVVELDSNYAEAWNNLGVVLAELRRLDEADAAYRRAIALGYGDAHFNLADLLDGRNQKAAARMHWRECAKLDPQGPYGEYARGKLVASVGG